MFTFRFSDIHILELTIVCCKSIQHVAYRSLGYIVGVEFANLGVGLPHTFFYGIHFVGIKLMLVGLERTCNGVDHKIIN